jgi:hypothetical protein
MCAFLLLLVGVVSGCGALRFGASPTPTPDAATILQRSGKASYHDATFTLTVSSPLAGNTGTPLASGTGAITTSPARTHFTMTYSFDFSSFLPTPTPSATPKVTPKATPKATPSPMPLATPTQMTIEIITDTATNTTYMRMTGLPSVGGVSLGDSWIKTTVSGDVSPGSPIDVSAITGLTNMGNEKKAHLIGVETLDGVKVYHLQSSVTTTTTIGGTSMSSTTVTDYYVRQDNYRPVKLVSGSSSKFGTTTSGAATTSTTTLAFTAYDTGVTIDLPQV